MSTGIKPLHIPLRVRTALMSDTVNYIELLPIYVSVYEFEERAGIIEFEGKLSKSESEKMTYEILKLKYNF